MTKQKVVEEVLLLEVEWLFVLQVIPHLSEKLIMILNL